jgi:hypothetical protein
MKQTGLKLVVMVVLLLSFAATVSAQSPASVGALLDQGGKQLTGDEVSRLYSGATVSGVQIGRPGTKFSVAYKPDGTASGSASWPGGNTNVSGSWSVNNVGQICNDFRNSSGGTIKGCNSLFRLGDKFYTAKTSDRAEPIYERQYVR